MLNLVVAESPVHDKLSVQHLLLTHGHRQVQRTLHPRQHLLYHHLHLTLLQEAQGHDEVLVLEDVVIILHVELQLVIVASLDVDDGITQETHNISLVHGQYNNY